MSDKLVVIFVEGATEISFYKKFVSHIHEKNGGSLSAKIIYKNLKGIGNYKIQARNHLLKHIIPNHPKERITVLLCHDTDVFEGAAVPPVDWKKIRDELIKISEVNKVDFIKAKKSIEDWFLYDEVGILKFLRLPPETKVNGRGFARIKELFKKANKLYVKGGRHEAERFMDALNIGLIASIICEDIKPLCKALGMNCISIICGE